MIYIATTTINSPSIALKKFTKDNNWELIVTKETSEYEDIKGCDSIIKTENWIAWRVKIWGIYCSFISERYIHYC